MDRSRAWRGSANGILRGLAALVVAVSPACGGSASSTSSGSSTTAATGGAGGTGGSMSCTPPEEACAAGCTDTSKDAANCGSCGHACKASQVCKAGACVTPIGGDCTSNADCTEGQGASCDRSQGASSGSCTAECSTDADCGELSLCVQFSDQPFCGRKCGGSADCPQEQVCWIALPSSAPVCFGGISGITHDCDPAVVDCTVGGKPGGCQRVAVGAGMTGRCIERCTVGDSTCAAMYGAPRGCFALDETKDGNGQPNGDTLRGTYCQYIQPEVGPDQECKSTDDGNHYFDICPQGYQCDLLGDQICHQLCYLGGFTPPPPPMGTAVGPCASGACKDVFGLAGTATPVGLCE